MVRCIGILLALTVSVTVAQASDLFVSVESGGKDAIIVPPGFAVDYEVVGELSDTSNEGLALILFDLSFDGGDLVPASEPAFPPMTHFANDRGVNNPAGFGGTIVAGGLAQIGGMQNTMNNVAENTPFPIGPVITGVAQSGHPVTLAAGTLITPETPGVYSLQLVGLMANLILPGEDGTGFWATAPTDSETVTSLMIVVDELAVAIADSMPPTGVIDARQPWSPDGSEVYGWDTFELTIVGDPSSVIPADFEVTHTAATDPPTVVSVTPTGDSVIIELSNMIEVLEWTVITHSTSGTYVRFGYLPGDVDGSRQANVNDILALIDHLNGEVLRPDYQTDIDRNGVTDSDDVFRLLDLLNGEDTYPIFLGAELPE